MITIPRSFSALVRQDGLEALADPHHPCRHMVTWQQELPGNEGAPFQLPEPFSGDRAELNLVLVGLNPSFSPGEYIPTADPVWTEDSYDQFYRNRFTDDFRRSGRVVVYERGARESRGERAYPVTLWNNIERLFSELTATADFQLGTHALLIEIVHFKSTKGYLGDVKQSMRLLEHQRTRTRQLLDAIGPCVLVPMGNAAVGQLFPLLGLESQVDTIGGLIGRAFEAQTSAGHPVSIVPVKHLSYNLARARRPEFAAALTPAIARIGSARARMGML